jgi:hypothetical protein
MSCSEMNNLSRSGLGVSQAGFCSSGETVGLVYPLGLLSCTILTVTLQQILVLFNLSFWPNFAFSFSPSGGGKNILYSSICVRIIKYEETENITQNDTPQDVPEFPKREISK